MTDLEEAVRDHPARRGYASGAAPAVPDPTRLRPASDHLLAPDTTPTGQTPANQTPTNQMPTDGATGDGATGDGATSDGTASNGAASNGAGTSATPQPPAAPRQPGPQQPAAPAAPGTPQTPDEIGDWRAQAWPVPGHRDLNKADPGRHQGDGSFHSRGGEHQGVDIQAPEGAAVVAASDGVVVRADDNDRNGYGNQIVIDHGNGIYTQYAHLNAQIGKNKDGKSVMTFTKPDGTVVQLMVGEKIRAGDQIGVVGRTGNVPPKADSHLHFELRHGSPAATTVGGHVADPMRHLP